MSQNYIEETRSLVTASKLKNYETNPYLYKLKYVDEIVLEEEEERYFIVWDAFHYLMEHWEEKFLEKYTIADWYLKANLMDMILERSGLDDEDKKEYLKGLKKLKLDGLREERYGTEKYHLMSYNIQLTRAEWEMVLWMYKSCKSQELFDIWCNGYICEERMTAMYKNIMISMKPDRRMVHDEKWKMYSLVELEKLLSGKTKDEQEKIINEKKLTSIIRDFKTTADIVKIRNNLTEGFDDYGYMTSMSFYYTVIFVLYWLESTVYLDFVDRKPPHITEVIALDTKNHYFSQDIVATNIFAKNLTMRTASSAMHSATHLLILQKRNWNKL